MANRLTISNAIVEALDLPYYNHKRGPGWKIANAFVQALTDMIRSGEPIEVTGFGIFKLKSRKAHMGGNGTKSYPLPASKWLVFTPSPSLLRYLNEQQA